MRTGSRPDWLRAQGIQLANVIGGTAAVGEDVATELRAEGLEVGRLSGPDRYATSRAVAEHSATIGLVGERTWYATGVAFADALAGGPAAAADTGVLLLVDGEDPGRSQATLEWLDERSGTFERITLIGGQAAISDTARREVERAAR